MRDDSRSNPKVLEYLRAENAYTSSVMAPTQALQDELYAEIIGHLKETDLGVPYRKGQYYYYRRTVKGLDYPIYCRKRGSLEADEEIVLDINSLKLKADDPEEYLGVGFLEVSPNQQLLAYGVDRNGSELYTLKVRDLRTGKDLDGVEVSDLNASFSWGDDATYFITRVDAAKRPDRVLRRTLGEDSEELIYREGDERFRIAIYRSLSEAYLFLLATSTETTEYRVLETATPKGAFRLMAPREQGHRYFPSHHDATFYIRSNADGAINYKLMRAPVTATARSAWEEVIAHRDDITLRSVSAFKDHLVLRERIDGLPAIRIRKLADGSDHVVAFEEQAYWVSLGANEEFNTGTLRLVYTSMATPRTVYDYDMETRQLELKKRKEVPGYTAGDYVTERISVQSHDGVEVPISLVYKKGARDGGAAPMLLRGYGSYGIANDPRFSAASLSLLDRGVIVALAHVRGGGEKGERWYRAGKYEHKRNTFLDFIACARGLVAKGYTSADKLAIRGGSAGGLLVGAVINMAPDVAKAAVAEVPFVDVTTTILDESIPLTTGEWEEWGNPVKSKKYYDYIKSYSPYDNVSAQDYPALLVTAGLHDPRVAYWEPAKWVAKLRATRRNAEPRVLKTYMGAGHGGASGRYEAYRDEAFVQAFILWQLGVEAPR